jgi:hypothetical protein
MLRIALLFVLLFQSSSDPRPTIVAQWSEPPHRNFYIISYDDKFLFAARHYGSASDPGGNTEPGLFVHSKEHSSWIQITKISTVGGRFGTSRSEDPEARKKLRFASIGWDFRRYAQEGYAPQPMLAPGFLAFPEKITYDPTTDLYKLRYLTSWKVPSAESVLYLKRSDLTAVFAKNSRGGN